MVIVIGHKSPDTDTVISAMVAAEFLNLRSKSTEYEARITDKVNSETEFVLQKFNVKAPEVLFDATGKKLFLVDHNEKSQVVEGDSKIVGIIDHHKMLFDCAEPIEIVTKPWGCTCTILYDLFKKEGLLVPEKLKGPLLCAILSDTVILRSPTTTRKDISVVEKLSKELSIDYHVLGMEMFKAKAQVGDKTPQEIIQNDFKDFTIGGKTVGIGQIETPDVQGVLEKTDELVGSMKNMEGYHSVILMITDIINEGTRLLIVGKEDAVAKIFNTKISNHLTDFIPGMMSRKKQVAPPLTEKL